ncbi:sulfotransferase [Candidatus Marimicrobium litorale]|uniref:Sulfotransferase family protein n=1 Tax=Candidatus Marimicrobium litorale TaxID=2518991 RepID=A0ABT3T6F3_9GAMM|nr:sulfotransferase [Candidatus Marimicrobium litorale]MCX2977401.1 sulfotransferase family protein [Candidatus Marimicrobium litorale]
MSSEDVSISERTGSFARNVKLETLLKDINSSLSVAEEKALSDYRMPQLPVILIVGPMRSGTTLFMQWLANTGIVCYPTNLLSRFYQAPIIGAKIQLLLTDPDYSFRDELGEFMQQAEYKSQNGKTKGVLAPNEFWYFWRRFLAEPDRDVWTDDELRQSMDTQTMLRELAGIIDVFQKPFAAKGLLFNNNIPFLDSIIENVLFVQIERDPVSNVASVLDARKKQLGREDQWYSFEIPEYEELKHLPPLSQVAGQVHYINKAVATGMGKVSAARKITISYEKFCADPAQVFTEMTKKLGLSHCKYDGPSHFNITRAGDIRNQTEIESAIRLFAGGLP